MTKETFQETFNVGERARLEVSNLRGSVKIQRGRAGQIQVTAVVHTGSGDAERTRVEIRQNGDGSVVAETRFAESPWGIFGMHKPCKVDYTIYAPQNCRLRASAVSSSLDVAGIEGLIQASAVSGPVDLRNLTGDLKINAVSGGVRGANLAGSLQLETVSGDVALEDCDLSPVTGKTVSGQVSLQSHTSEGAYRLRSVSGDVRLEFPDASAARVRMSSVSGRFNANLPISHDGRDRGERLYIIGEGGPDINFNSISGDLRLNLAAQLAANPAQPGGPLQGDSVVTPMEILERIERGEFSVEDGLQALSGEHI